MDTPLFSGLRVIDAASSVAKVPPRVPLGLGEHSSEILRELGYGDADIDRLIAARVIVQER